ncbi:MAG: hypothetical protein EZS28_035780 [Streblomastix strix]|uniref:Uncharacterized protein n=1 Tax=Streblomastix strix TaxID=222440 RepID=A0A5J4UF05_9EUKA|nr:MAG: hypothetical protein EZS28_035780 [Streblomastix strix]
MVTYPNPPFFPSSIATIFALSTQPTYPNKFQRSVAVVYGLNPPTQNRAKAGIADWTYFQEMGIVDSSPLLVGQMEQLILDIEM